MRRKGRKAKAHKKTQYSNQMNLLISFHIKKLKKAMEKNLNA